MVQNTIDTNAVVLTDEKGEPIEREYLDQLQESLE